MANSNLNVELQGRIVRFEDLLNSIQNYASSLQERTNAALSEENLKNLVYAALQDEELFTRLTAEIVNRIGVNIIISSISREMSQAILDKINKTIENKLTEKALLPIVNQLLQMHTNGQVSLANIPRNDLKPEEIPLNSTDNIDLLCQVLAGDDAIM